MIVNKPQFDTDAICPGEVYWLQKQSCRYNIYEINLACIIKSVKPLTIVVYYYNKKTGLNDELTIDINSIVNKTYILTKMVKEKKEEETIQEGFDF